MSHSQHVIAIIEDNADLNGILVQSIRGSGFRAHGYGSVEAFEETSGPCPHIFLLDLNLPGEDGISFAARLRASRPDAGIIMLTARNEMDQRKRGYDSGADIYLTKPSSIDEITGALSALARRIPSNDAGAAAGLAESLILNRRKLELQGPGGVISVSVDEAEFLSHCANDREGRVSLDQIRDTLLDGANLSKVAIELKVVRIRKKLTAVGLQGRSVCSVRNHGYQLLVPIRLVQV